VPSALKEKASINYDYDDYLVELRGRLRPAHEVARHRLISKKEKSKEYYDKEAERGDFQVGQKVLFHNEAVPRERSKKLSPQYVGPYDVVHVDVVNVTVKRGRKTQKVHMKVKVFY
jgi:hypothetical protein